MLKYQVVKKQAYRPGLTTDSTFCMEVGHQLLVQKSELGRGFRDFRPCFIFVHNILFVLFVLCNLVRQSICTSMPNLKSVVQKWLSYEYFVLLYFFKICTLFGQSIQTSMQNIVCSSKTGKNGKINVKLNHNSFAW